jgi:hypothetical protein
MLEVFSNMNQHLYAIVINKELGRGRMKLLLVSLPSFDVFSDDFIEYWRKTIYQNSSTIVKTKLSSYARCNGLSATYSLIGLLC